MNRRLIMFFAFCIYFAVGLPCFAAEEPPREQIVESLLRVLFYPGFLLAMIAVLIFTIHLHRKEKQTKKTLSFNIGACLNGFALFSTLSTILMSHPLRQRAWQFWMEFFSIPLFGLMFCILVAGIMSILYFAFVVHKLNGIRPWQAFFYQLLTLVHCMFAINWLGWFMPTG